jgi:hypothetical protein
VKVRFRAKVACGGARGGFPVRFCRQVQPGGHWGDFFADAAALGARCVPALSCVSDLVVMHESLVATVRLVTMHFRASLVPVLTPRAGSDRRRKAMVLTDLVESASCERGELLRALEAHVTDNLVRLGPQHFVQTCGIPQGSVVSSLLCCCVYGHLERSRLASLPSLHTAFYEHQLGAGADAAGVAEGAGAASGPEAGAEVSLLMRMIDDSLYVSADLGAARAFLRTMARGHPDYGTALNLDKSRVSFHVQVSGGAVQRVEGGEVRWCGLILHVRTLEVRADYARCLPHPVLIGHAASLTPY